MKLISYVLFSVILTVCAISSAKTQDMNAAISAATPQEKNDLFKLMTQITMVPTKETQNGKPLFKITKIAKGSFWERMGWKVGDFVSQ